VCSLGVDWFGKDGLLITCVGDRVFCRVGVDRVAKVGVLIIARAETDGTRAETRFCLSPKRTSPFKSMRASVQSTAGSRRCAHQL